MGKLTCQRGESNILSKGEEIEFNVQMEGMVLGRSMDNSSLVAGRKAEWRETDTVRRADVVDGGRLGKVSSKWLLFQWNGEQSNQLSKDEDAVLEVGGERKVWSTFRVSRPKKCSTTAGPHYSPFNTSGHEFKWGRQLEKAEIMRSRCSYRIV